jgi:autotransporter translocation and assembly factor TamB
MKRIFKWTLGGLIGLLIVLVVLAAAAPVVVNNRTVQRWVLRQVNAAFNGTLSLGSLQVSLFKGKLSARKVLLTDKTGKAIARVVRLETGISWPLLLHGVLQLEPVILENPWADLQIDADGTVNIAQAFESPHPAPEASDAIAPTVILRSVRLTGGQVLLHMPDYDLTVEARGVGLSGKADFSTFAAEATLSADRVRYQGQGLDSRLSDLRLRAALDGSRLEVHTLGFQSGSSSLKLSGSLDDLYQAPRFNLSVLLESRLADIGRLLDAGLRSSGPVTAALDFAGTLENPRADLQVRYGGGELWERPVRAADLHLTLADLKLALAGNLQGGSSGRVTLQAAVDLGPAFADHRLTFSPHIERIGYSWDIRTENVDLAGLLPQLPDLVGRLTAVVHGQGRGLRPPDMNSLLNLQAELEQVKEERLAAPLDMALSLQADVDKGVLTVSELSLRTGGTSLDGRGHYDMKQGEGQADLEVAAADLARDFSLLGIQGIAGRLDGRASAAGSLEKPQFEVSLQGRGLMAAGVKIGDVAIEGRMGQEGVLQVPDLRIENGPSRISATGRLPLADILSGKKMSSDVQLTAVLTHVTPRDFMADFPLTGYFSGQLSASGRLPHLAARAVIKGHKLESAGVRAGDLEADLRLKGTDVFLDRLRVTNRRSEIRADGRVGLLRKGRLALAADPAFRLRVAAEDLRVGDFIDQARGRVSLRADLQGSFRHPAGTVRLEASGIETAVQNIADVRLLARMAGDTLEVDDFLLSPVPGQQIAGQGRISRNGAYTLQLAGSGLSLEAIDWVRRHQAARGKLDLKVSGQGTLKNPRLQADVLVSSLQVNGKPLEDMALRVDMQDARAHLEGRLGFDVQADYDLQNDDFVLSAVLEQTDLTPYLRLADMQGWSGSLTGRLSGRGRLKTPAESEATLDLDRVKIFHNKRKIIGGRALALSFGRGQIDFRNVSLDLLEQGRLDIRGRAALDGPLAIRLEGDLPLEALQAFAAELGNPRGRLKLQADVGGSFNAPAVTGKVDLEGIGFIVPGLDQRLHDLNGCVRLSPGRIEIEEIAGLLDDGRLVLTGSADVRGLTPSAVALKLEARQLAVEPAEDVQAVVNAELSLSGNLQKSLLAGRVEMVEGYYERDVDLNLLKIAGQELTSLGRRKRAFQAPEQTIGKIDLPFVKNLRFDVAFTTRQPFVVDNDLAYMEISADLKLRGSAARPSVSGRASVDSGTITFQGRPFEVTKGIIDFVNPYRIEPHLDITSEGQVGSYRVFLSLEGTVQELELKLSSDPPLSDADILSLILLGRTTRQAGGGGLSGEGIAAGLISSGLGNKVKKTAGLDILQAETQPTDEDSGDSTAPVRITVGKNLNRRLSVKYQFTTGGDENIQRTVAEYKLLEDLIAIGYQESTGTYGGMLKYRLEFR